jgi:hypothetical protein
VAIKRKLQDLGSQSAPEFLASFHSCPYENAVFIGFLMMSATSGIEQGLQKVDAGPVCAPGTRPGPKRSGSLNLDAFEYVCFDGYG